MASVYYILCLSNNKLYIGSTVRRLKTRFIEHRSKLRTNLHANKQLQNSWNLYKEENFEFGLIEECDNSVVIYKESHYVTITGCYLRDIGFNKSAITDNPRKGVKQTEEFKLRVSQKLKGKISPNRREIIDLSTNKIFDSVINLSRHYNITKYEIYKNLGKKFQYAKVV